MATDTGRENETTTMEPVLVRRAGPADVIAYVWYELGYQPHDSVVLVAVHGVRNRLGSIARADLPPPHTRRSVLAEYARGLAAPVLVAGADRVMVLICGDGALHRPEPPVVQVLLKELPKAGLNVTDVLGVNTAGYRSLLCADLTCCPPGGNSLAGVLATATAAAQVVIGRSFGAEESDLVADVEPATAEWDDDDRDDDDWDDEDGEDDDWDDDDWDDEDVGERPGRRCGWHGGEPADLDDAALGPDAGGEPDRVGRRWQWWCWWRDEIGRRRSGEPGPSELIKVFWRILSDLILRDVVLMHAMGAPVAECEQLLRASGDGWDWGRWDRALREVIGRPPSASDLHLARELLASTARHARAGQRAPVLSVLAWLAWFEGNGGRARLLVQQALDDTPGYTLALLVNSFLLGAVPPPWYQAGHHDALDE